MAIQFMRLLMSSSIVVGFAVSACIQARAQSAAGDGVRLNQIQVVGTHNSYHVAPTAEVMEQIADFNKSLAQAVDYTHRPFAEQFSKLGIRQIELDVWADPAGGLFASPFARRILKAKGKKLDPDPNEGGVLDKPGLKVLHFFDFDYRTTAPTFKNALEQVKAWSKENPRHIPIMILVELKDEPQQPIPRYPVKFDKTTIEFVDKEILEVFDRSDITTPDDVRGKEPTLRGAIVKNGWPALDQCRGKVMFALDNEGAIRDLYLADRPSLEGRLMFASVDPESPAAGWFKINDSIIDYDRIRSLVERGFMVRTRADADTVQARKNDVERRDRALSSGAQFVSTDFPEPRPEFSPYKVVLPGGAVARPNPVAKPKTAPAIVDLEGKLR
jgi:hypothetical protein